MKRWFVLLICLLTFSTTPVFADFKEHIKDPLENDVVLPERRRFEVVYPDSYSKELIDALVKNLPITSSISDWYGSKGKGVGLPVNSIVFVNGEHSGLFYFDDLIGNRGFGDDFVKMMSSLDQNNVVRVGSDVSLSFFGHYYDLSGTGVFNRLVDDNLISVGSMLFVTDSNGLTKQYEFTQLESLLNVEQDYYYYGDNAVSMMAYDGIGEEMALIQYCRWDVDYGRLMLNFAHRVPFNDAYLKSFGEFIYR